MDILFIIDRLELKYFEFNNLVTNFWIIRELLKENKNVFITTIDNLSLVSGEAYTHCYEAYEKDKTYFMIKLNNLKRLKTLGLLCSDRILLLIWII